MGWYSETPSTCSSRKENTTMKPNQPTSRKVITEGLQAQKNVFFKKFILFLFLGLLSWFQWLIASEHDLLWCEQRNHRKWETVLKQKLGDLLWEGSKAQMQVQITCLPSRALPKRSLSKDSRALKMGREQLPTKQARRRVSITNWSNCIVQTPEKVSMNFKSPISFV